MHQSPQQLPKRLGNSEKSRPVEQSGCVGAGGNTEFTPRDRRVRPEVEARRVSSDGTSSRAGPEGGFTADSLHSRGPSVQVSESLSQVCQRKYSSSSRRDQTGKGAVFGGARGWISQSGLAGQLHEVSFRPLSLAGRSRWWNKACPPTTLKISGQRQLDSAHVARLLAQDVDERSRCRCW